VLSRLERTIWAAQAYTLSQLLERTSESERSVLDSILEQISWKLGRNFAERKWLQLSDETRQKLPRLLLAFADTPFGSAPFSAANSGQSFLVLRATEREAQIELHHCPHQSPFNEVLRIANELCAVHHHWTRGFAYGLHHRLQVTLQMARSGHPEKSKEKGLQRPDSGHQRCGQHWTFAHGS
jgi:hypothetical protein